MSLPRTPAILFVLTSHGELGESGRKTGFWLSEAAHPWQVFTDAGCRVEFVSVRGGRPPVDGGDLSDPVQRAFLEEIDLDVIARLDDVDPGDYDAVLYVGGHGAMWDFPGNPALARIGSLIHAAGGVVAAVCHGPAGLLDLTRADGRYLLDGRNVTSFTNAEERESGVDGLVPFFLQDALAKRGAHHSDGGVYRAHVVVDERVVTGQNPASAAGVARAVLELLDR
ncbi:type 1 glutamine amidotransferase domain-containing protein [Streptomyces sp. NPDC004609]|uniref:type 1 glutamine amidotransferase domain-containing protein n=1 Tax=Streptomyces sp. NPDC004609 TaxID=3364704 RepID=UPI0036B39A14